MNKSIMPYNDKGQRHGYWEQNWANGQLMYKCIFINNKENGFEVYYSNYGKLTVKNYYL